MNARLRFLLVLIVGLATLPASTTAHFKLLEPASWIERPSSATHRNSGRAAATRRDRTRSC